MANRDMCVVRRLWLSLAICGMIVTFASAQEDRSHRLIESPQVQGLDFVKQMELLQRLQTLSGQLNQQTDPSTGDDAPSPTPQSVSPEDLDKLRNLLTRMGISPPAGASGRQPGLLPGNGPQRDGNQLSPEDAERQRMLEELMRRLSGQPPPNNPHGENTPHGENMPQPPASSDSSSKASEHYSPEPPQSPEVTKRSRRDGPSGTSSPSQNSSDPSNSDDGRASQNQQHSSSSGTTSRFFGNAPRRQTQDDTLLSNSGEVPRSTIDDVEHQMSPWGVNRRRPSGVSSSLIDPEQLPSEDRRPTGRGLFHEQAGRDLAEQMRQHSGTAGQEASSNSGVSPDLLRQIPDWLETLRKLEGVPRDETPSAGRENRRNPLLGTSSDGAPLEESPSQLENLAKAVHESQSLQELGRNLRQTLTEASQQARQQTREASQSGPKDSLASHWQGIQASAQGALAGLRDSLAKSGEGRNPDEAGTREPAPAPNEAPSRRGRAIRDALSPIGDVARTANQWVMSPPAVPSPPNSTEGSPQLPDVHRLQVSWPLVLGLGMILGLLCWFWSRQHRAHLRQQALDEVIQMGLRLQCREDVIRVYHALAACSPAVGANWWPHQRATPAMAAARPEQEEPLTVLTRVYERARYLPEETALSVAELESARAAVEQCVMA